MPVGHNHYYYLDFKSHLHQVAPEECKQLAALEEQERGLLAQAREVRSQRLNQAEGFLAKNFETIKPLMRPCHQRRFERDGLKNAIEPEPCHLI